MEVWNRSMGRVGFFRGQWGAGVQTCVPASGGLMADHLWCSFACGQIMPISGFIIKMAVCVCVCVQICPFYTGSSRIGLGPTFMTSSELNHIFIDPLSKSGHILRSSRLGLHHANLESITQHQWTREMALVFRNPSSGPFGLPRDAQTLASVTQFHDKKAGSASESSLPLLPHQTVRFPDFCRSPSINLLLINYPQSGWSKRLCPIPKVMSSNL